MGQEDAQRGGVYWLVEPLDRTGSSLETRPRLILTLSRFTPFHNHRYGILSCFLLFHFRECTRLFRRTGLSQEYSKTSERSNVR